MGTDSDGGTETYLRDRGITRDSVERFQLGFDGQRLTIPYLTPAGPWHVKRRCIHQGACDGHPKYKNDEGASQHLFNAQTLLDAERVVVVEGELDAICVEQLGVPAVGFPGADTWRANSRVWRWCFDSVLEVVVVADGDLPREGREIGVGEEAARSVAESLRSSLPDLDVRTVVLPVGMDANSYIHQEGGMAFLEKIGWL